MSSIKDELYSAMEERGDRKLAAVLGITYDELGQTDWEIEEDKNDDDLVYGMIVHFSETSPKSILEKIAGIDENNNVYLGAGALDDGDGDDDINDFNDTDDIHF